MAQDLHILLIQRDPEIAETIKRYIRAFASDIHLHHILSSEEAAERLDQSTFDAVVYEPEDDTPESIVQLRELTHSKGIPIILLSQVNGQLIKDKAEELGAQEYSLRDKLNLVHLHKLIKSAIETRRLRERLAELEALTEEQSNVQRQMLQEIPLPILIHNAAGDVLFANAEAQRIIIQDAGDLIRSQLKSISAQQDFKSLELESRSLGRLRLLGDSCQWQGQQQRVLAIQELGFSEAKPSADNNFSKLLQATSDPSILIADGLILEVNQAFEALFGIAAEALKEQALNERYPGLAETIAEPTSKLASGPMGELGMNTAQGLITLKLFGEPYMLGEKVYWRIALRPPSLQIEEGKQLSPEKILHLASHDLREPLRVISNYTQLIGKKLEAGEYDEVKEYLEYTVDGTRQMERILADMKNFLSRDITDKDKSPISLTRIIEAVLNDVQPLAEEAGAVIHAGTMPELRVDVKGIKEVFRHLIYNAIHFRDESRPAVVQVGAQELEKEWLFSVRDNGIGIDPEYQEKIFELFGRLKRDDQSGSGMGLPIVRRIVENHGGKVWLESLQGHGSTFYFTLPKV